MLESLVLWLALAIIDGEPRLGVFPDESVCTEAVRRGRLQGMVITDCVKVEFSKPKQASI